MNDKEATDKEAEKKEEFIYQRPGDTLSDVIYVGDNFVVNAEEGNSEGVDFYILKCTLCKQCATQNIVSAGTFYIEGIFYARLDDYDYVYRLLQRQTSGIQVLSFGQMHQHTDVELQ